MNMRPWFWLQTKPHLCVFIYIRARSLGQRIRTDWKPEWDIRISGLLGIIATNLNRVSDLTTQSGDDRAAKIAKQYVSSMAQICRDIRDKKLVPPQDNGASFLEPLRKVRDLINTPLRLMNSNGPSTKIVG